MKFLTLHPRKHKWNYQFKKNSKGSKLYVINRVDFQIQRESISENKSELRIGDMRMISFLGLCVLSGIFLSQT